MDGALLVLDSRSLPNLHALATVDVPVAAQKAHWRHRTFPAMAALILASVFSLVYFVSTQRGGAPPVTVPAVTLPASSLVPPAHLNPTPEPQTASNDTAAVPANETKTETKAPATASPKAGAAKTTSKISTTQRKPGEEKKEESKVGSILKKTGRILKKPFKL
jgi:hypothetical protein